MLTVEDGAHHPSSTAATASASVSGEEPPPPPKPPRPVTEQQKNVQLLKEAFPSIDLAVIKAVLSAAGGKMDPAFNALLGSLPFRVHLRDTCSSGTYMLTVVP